MRDQLSASRRITDRDIRVVQVTARKHASLEAGLVGLPGPRLVLTHQARVADDIRWRESRRGGGSRSLLGDAGFAQALEERLKLGHIRRVVTHRRPERAGAGDGEVRVEYAADPDCGTRFVNPTDLREGDSPSMCRRSLNSGPGREPRPPRPLEQYGRGRCTV
jgi:hypothetical protein